MNATTKMKLLGALHAALGGFGLLVGGAFLVQAARESSASVGEIVLVVVLFLWAIYFVPAFVGGLGLLNGYRWARPVMIGVSCVTLLIVPIGTVIGALGLWILLGADGKAALVRPAPRVKIERPETGIVLAIAGVGSFFAVALNTGFLVTGKPAPPELAMLFYPAIAILVVTLILAIRGLAQRRARAAAATKPN